MTLVGLTTVINVMDTIFLTIVKLSLDTGIFLCYLIKALCN
jgi:hypothetical protein